MSRLSEWMEREECHINSVIREMEHKITKAQSDINAYNSEMESAKDDLRYILRAKAVLEELETTDPNGQMKLEGFDETTR